MMRPGYPTASWCSQKDQMYFSPNMTATMRTSCLPLLALPAASDFPQMGLASASRSRRLLSAVCLRCGKLGRMGQIHIRCYLTGTIRRRSAAVIGHLTEGTSYSKVFVMVFPVFGLRPTDI